MPAGQIDVQAPLMRRKALIQKLLAQAQGGGAPSPGPSVRAGAAKGRGVAALAAGQGVRPSGGEGRGAMIAGLSAPKFQAPFLAAAEHVPSPIYQPAPEPPAPVAQPAAPAAPAPIVGGPDPGDANQPQYSAPVTPTAWQTGGFLNETAYNEWNAMDEAQQANILRNPNARARYFA